MQEPNSKKVEARIAHFPVGDKNPYNKLLCAALEAANFNVTKKPNQFNTNPWHALKFAIQYDLVHWHWFNGHYESNSAIKFVLRSLIFLGTLGIIRLSGTKMVCTIHNLLPHEARFKTLHKIVNRGIGYLAHALIVHNQAAIKEVAEVYGSKHKIHVVEHIDYGTWIAETDRQHQPPTDDSMPNKNTTKTVVFFGQLRPYKGIEYLLDAAQYIDHKVIIAGRPISKDYEADLRNLCDLYINVSLLPKFLDDQELHHLLSNSDVAVFPYDDSLASGAAHMALAHNLPLVAPATTAFRDLIDMEICTEWTLPKTGASLAKAIELAISGQNQGSQSAISLYRRKCSQQEVGKKLQGLYLMLLGKPTTAPS